MPRCGSLPTGFYAVQGWFRSANRLGARCRYAAFKRGYMAGQFGRGRWPTPKLSRLGNGMLHHFFALGWNLGREYRGDVNVPPPPPRGPRGGKRMAA